MNKTPQQDFLIDIFELTSGDLAYFAGLFDGEGTIGLAKMAKQNSYSFSLGVGMTSPKAINDLHNAFGGRIWLKEYPNPKWRPLWNWYVYGKRAELILRTLLPFLRVKREEAELVLRMRNYTHKVGFAGSRNKLIEQVLAIRHGKESIA